MLLKEVLPTFLTDLYKQIPLELTVAISNYTQLFRKEEPSHDCSIQIYLRDKYMIQINDTDIDLISFFIDARHFPFIMKVSLEFFVRILSALT